MTELYLPSKGETGLRHSVIKLIDERDLWWVYFPDSRKIQGNRGWPDLTIGRQGNLRKGHGRVIYRELKDTDGTLSIGQRKWGSILTGAGHDWAVWRPADLLSGTIARQLDKIA